MRPPFNPLLLRFCIVLTALTVSVPAGDWPQWRGPLRDGHAAPDERLPDSLPASFEPRWQQPVGGGFASPIVAGSRLFLLEEIDGKETARALKPETGEELWRTPYAPAQGDEWGSGPRCTPVADDGRLYVQSLRGEFACLDQTDGRRLWGFSFEKDYGVKWEGGNDGSDSASRRRGHNGSPIILRDRIYVPVGATNGGTIVCFDKKTGTEIWRVGSDETAYAPLMTATLAGREQVIAFSAPGLTGLMPTTGEVLWRIPLRTAANRHAVTPIILRDEVIVSSHSIGLRNFRIETGKSGQDSRFVARPAWSNPSLKTSLATLVYVDGFFYGQGPDRNLICVSATNGVVQWSQSGFGERPLVGYSATLAAGRRLLVLTDDGQLVLLAAEPSRYTELGRAQVCGKTWSHPALAEGRLYLRDRRALLAFDLPAPAGTR